MASLLDLTTNVAKLSRPIAPRPPSRSAPRQPTQYEAEMRYFSQPIKEEEVKKRKRIPLLSFIFDVLQVGNYASANIVDSIYDSIKYNKPLGEAAWDAVKSGFKGLTLQDKNTFSDIIKQNAEEHGEFLGKSLEEWTKPLQEKYEGDDKLKTLFNRTLGSITPAGALGLAGDIFLDPLTYISPLKALRPTGMATEAARAAATKYAPDVLKLNQALTTLDTLKTGARVGREGLADVAKKGASSVARQQDVLYRQAYKEALQTPADVLQKQMQTGLEQVKNLHMEKTMKELTEQGMDIRAVPETLMRPQGLDALTQSIESGYKGAGERGTRILGREVGKGVRQANPLAQGIDKLGAMLSEKAEKSGLAEAWYSLVNGPSVVGLLKRTFGIRNPYQKLLNARKMDAEGIRLVARNEVVEAVDPLLRDMGEDLLQKAVDARAIMEQVEFAVLKGQKRVGKAQEALSNVLGSYHGQIRRIQDVLKGVDNFDETIKVLKARGLDASVFEKLKALGITKEDADKIGKFWEGMDNAFKGMRDKEMGLVEKGIFKQDEMGQWQNYIPKIQNRPFTGKKRAGKLISPADPGFMKTTKATYLQSEKQGIEFAKEMFGNWIEAEAKATGQAVDVVAKKFIEDNGLAPISTNLEEMLNARITAHARVMGRGNLIESMREFGIPAGVMEDMGKFAKAGYHRMGNIYNDLQASNDPGMAGLLFDKDVRDIVDKTYAMTASDDTMQGMKKLFMNFTSWWKGLATATPGFHMRNFFCNNVTGFFRHGMNWFDPRAYVRAAVGVAYALNPLKFKKILTERFNISEGQIDEMLSHVIGGKTLKQIAEEARENGIMSLKTMIGDVTKEVKPKVNIGKRFNPLSREFALPAASRQAGTFIENHARFHSYLLTLDDMAKSGVAEDAAKEFAKLDTKKWFLDYGDLSEAEQKYLKNIIPFYSWIRKNTANQISGLMLMPDMYRVAAKAEDAVTSEDFDYSLVPEYMKQAGYLPVSAGERGPMMWWPNFPYADLNKIPLFFEEGGMLPKIDPKALLEEFTSASHPIIKTFIQEASQENLFKKREFLDRVAAPDVANLIANKPQVITFIDNALRKMGFDGGMGINIKNGRLEMDEEAEQLLTVNIPLLRTVGKLIDGAIDATGLDQVIEETTGRKDKYEGMADLFDNLTYFFGMKFKEMDEEYESEQLARDIEAKAMKDRSAWKRTLPGYEQRALQYGLQRDAQRRRIGL